MSRTVPRAFGERMARQIGQTAAVDPDAFRDLCEEMVVWEDGEPADLWDTMSGAFGDDAYSATMRFLDLQSSLNDGTLAEFQCSTDDGRVATPYAVFEAAALAPLDEETSEIDRPLWFAEIMRRLASHEEAGEA